MAALKSSLRPAISSSDFSSSVNALVSSSRFCANFVVRAVISALMSATCCFTSGDSAAPARMKLR
jgi:hypothetical protein